MENKQKNFVIPLAFVGLMFFAIGFALGINGALMPVLQKNLGVSGAQQYLIVALTFIPFLIFGFPAGKTIKAIGYKKTMSLSFVFFVVAFLLFVYAAKTANFYLFLVAAFVSGAANAYLQASVNPYITILGPLDSAAKRISIMGICNKLAYPIPGIFLVWLIGKKIEDFRLDDFPMPFYVIIGAFAVLGVLAYIAPLPEVKAVGEDDNADSPAECAYASGKTSIWQFPHLLLGCLALFLYVGVESTALQSLQDYATYLKLDGAENYAWISPVGMVIGYIIGIILIPKYMSQATALKICSFIAIAGSILVPLTPPQISIFMIALLTLGCSLMWPALWPLAMADLGKFTKSGSSLLIMAMFGGAVIPTIFGWLKDLIGMQQAYWICLPCFLFILYYGVAGYKIRTK